MDNWLVWIGGGAALTTIISCWGQIKGFMVNISSYVVSNVTLYGKAKESFLIFLKTRARPTAHCPRHFEGFQMFVKSRHKEQVVIMEDVLGGNTKLYWIGKVPLLVTLKESGSDSDKLWNRKEMPVSIQFIRGMIDIDKILSESADDYNNLLSMIDGNHKRFFVKNVIGTNDRQHTSVSLSREVAPSSAAGCLPVETYFYKMLNYDISDISCTNSNSITIDKLFFDSHVYDLYNEIKTWYDSQKWYLSHSIPWKRGYCLYGPPGNGKSALVRCIAQELDMPIFSFNLNSLCDSEFSEEWSEMFTNSPCIALFEDIDAVYNKRALITQGVSFNCLINHIDGVKSSDGILIFINTNNSDSIDDAIKNRPGRIDKMVLMDNPSQENRMKIAKNILPDADEKDILNIVSESSGKSASYLQNICSVKAVNSLASAP